MVFVIKVIVVLLVLGYVRSGKVSIVIMHRILWDFFLKLQGYKSVDELLLEDQVPTTISTKTTTLNTMPAVTVAPVKPNNFYINFYDVFEILLGGLLTTFSGTSFYCLFKCIKNNCKCKVNFCFSFGSLLYIWILGFSIVIKIQKL
jgi:hypothetical protein